MSILDHKPERHDELPFLALVDYNKVLFHAYASGDHAGVKYLLVNFHIGDNGAFPAPQLFHERNLRNRDR